ncbi:GIY-YIG nuclease family protein [Acidithrix ferrooxidans]|uniref:GIY-YIG catalytic domain protein n=1 Tax=Acidithrix ferrooxidans TaxID=1280514 RepID=A0A0D8HIJ1_9ACTN|nr:GIY-YIG nuclease family protein [Acidithrix ferrooxidans]KJF17592.1 GIY-YIG catalytic domain protein [Acidithrix ferrooxidans]
MIEHSILFEKSKFESLSQSSIVLKPHGGKRQLKESTISAVPAEPGIYVLCARSRFEDPKNRTGINLLLSSLYYVIYVGKSNDLRKRLKEHIKASHNPDLSRYIRGLDTNSTIDFWCFTCPAEQLNEAESHLISLLNPATNKINGARILEGVPASGYRSK